MRAYVERQREHTFVTEARRQSRVLAEQAADPRSDETKVMRWIDDVSNVASWKA